MQRRVFLKQTMLFGGMALVGLPEFDFSRVLHDEETTGISPAYYLYGNRELGCALPRDFQSHAHQLPPEVAAVLY